MPSMCSLSCFPCSLSAMVPTHIYCASVWNLSLRLWVSNLRDIWVLISCTYCSKTDIAKQDKNKIPRTENAHQALEGDGLGDVELHGMEASHIGCHQGFQNSLVTCDHCFRPLEAAQWHAEARDGEERSLTKCQVWGFYCHRSASEARPCCLASKHDLATHRSHLQQFNNMGSYQRRRNVGLQEAFCKK